MKNCVSWEELVALAIGIAAGLVIGLALALGLQHAGDARTRREFLQANQEVLDQQAELAEKIEGQTEAFASLEAVEVEVCATLRLAAQDLRSISESWRRLAAAQLDAEP